MDKFDARFHRQEILEYKPSVTVYLCKRLSDNQLVVAKIYNKEHMKLGDILRLQNEGTVLTLLEGIPQQIQRLHYVEEERFIFLVMKYYCRGDLYKYCSDTDIFRNVPLKLRIARGVAEALYQFHQQGFAHRDLKLENIFLDENLLPYLGDYGFACYNKFTKSPEPLGSPAYVAPEVVNVRRGDELVDLQKTDMFSLGVLFYIMFCARFPFGGTTQYTMLQRDAIKPITPKDEVPMGMTDLIRGLLKISPNERMTWDEVFAPEHFMEDPIIYY